MFKKLFLRIGFSFFILLVLFHLSLSFFMNRPLRRDQQQHFAIDYYFAYGTNMSSKYLQNIRNVQTLQSRYAKLDDYKVTFGLKGPNFLEPSFALLIPMPSETAYGVVHKIKKSDFKKVINSESSHYQVVSIKIKTREGELIEAKTLIGTLEGKEQIPSQRYLDILIDGASSHQLPEDYTKHLSSLEGKYFPLLSEIMGDIIYTFVILKSYEKSAP